MKQQFIESGYSEFNDHWYSADALFQKRVKDEHGGTRYFVNIYYYRFSDYGGVDNYSVRLSLYDQYAVPHDLQFSMSYFSCIEDMEDHCYALWHMFGCNLDVLNQ